MSRRPPTTAERNSYPQDGLLLSVKQIVALVLAAAAAGGGGFAAFSPHSQTQAQQQATREIDQLALERRLVTLESSVNNLSQILKDIQGELKSSGSRKR
jgi:Flp pilus assembly protein TadB